MNSSVSAVKSVLWCDHVRVNPLGLIGGPLTLSVSGSSALVFEDDVLKVVCPRCLSKAIGAA